MTTIPLPFSRRTTAATATFACIFIASPQGAQTLTPVPTTLAALQLEYAQLINVYPQLIHQDTANNETDLNAAIASAETIVAALNATIDAMMASGDASFTLASMQLVAAHALVNLKNAQNTGDDE